MSPDRKHDFLRVKNTFRRRTEDPCKGCRYIKKRLRISFWEVEPCESFWENYKETGKPDPECPAQIRWFKRQEK